MHNEHKVEQKRKKLKTPIPLPPYTGKYWEPSWLQREEEKHREKNYLREATKNYKEMQTNLGEIYYNTKMHGNHSETKKGL